MFLSSLAFMYALFEFCDIIFLCCQVLKLLVGANISQEQLSHIAERTLLESDKSKDRRISFEEFKEVSNIQGRVCL